MGQLLYPTKKTINGPWLLSRKDIEELDKTIETIKLLLEQSLETEVKDTIIADSKNASITDEELKNKITNQKTKYPFEKKNVSIVLISVNDSRLRDKTIKGILKDNAIQDLRPKGLYINLEFGYNNKFQLDISNIYDGELNYDFNCYDSNISDEIKFEIEKWIEDNNPSKALQLWSTIGIYLFSIILLPILFGISILTINKEYSSYNEVMVSQTKELLKEGVNSNNRDKAIELLLKINTNYQPADFTATVKPKSTIYYKLLFLTILFCLISYFRPKTTIGLGKAHSQYNFYKIWIKFVTVTIPAILIIGPFWNKILEWLY